MAEKRKRKIKYFDRVDFIIACRNSVKQGYNRQIALTPQEEFGIPDGLFPVVFSMTHEHIAGEPAKPHVRCIVGLCERGGTATLDVDADFFEALPEKEIEVAA